MPRTYGTSAERGYGYQHEAKRREWKPKVGAGQVDCHAFVCLEERDGHRRWVQPGTRWHLGHTLDRSRWAGPEHKRCNTSEGALRGNAQRGRTGGAWRASTAMPGDRWVL